MAKRNTTWTLQDLKAHAKLEHAGKCLSSDYTRNDRKYLWKCKNKLHEPFEAGWDNVNRGRWCKACSDQKLRRDFVIIKSKVKEFGGTLISKKSDYKTNKSQISYKCEFGHLVNSNWQRLGRSRIDKSGTKLDWCSKCTKKRPHTLSEVQEMGMVKGFELLSEEYKGNKIKLLWRCRNQHKFQLNVHNLLNGQGCSKCSHGYGEAYARFLFEHIFESKFPSDFPDWLNGKQLDGYNDELKLAFEYQGIQHYKYTPYFHSKGIKDFKSQKKRDQLKRKACISHGVTLIEIDYKIPALEIEDFLLKEALRLDLQIKNPAPIEIQKFHDEFYIDDLEPILDIVKSKNGKCLTPVYLGEATLLKFECQKGHVFYKKPSSIKKGIWCPHEDCYSKAPAAKRAKDYIENKGGKLLSDYKNQGAPLTFECEKGHLNDTTWQSLRGHWYSTCAGNKKGTIEEMRKIASIKGGRCLSEKYLGSSTNLKWECRMEHKWSATPSNVKTNGAWCPECKPNFKLTLKGMQDLAEKFNGKCTSFKYHNTRTKLNWECSKNHKWSATPNNILKGNWCPTCREIDKKALRLEKINKIAVSKGGICLSTKYVDYFTELKFKCKNNHTWKVSPKNLFRDSWCKKCN